MNKLQPVALGVAIGVLWAVYVAFLAIIGMFGWGSELVSLLASLYIGYAPTIVGTIIGAVWGFVDGFIAGFVIAWIYNRIAT